MSNKIDQLTKVLAETKASVVNLEEIVKITNNAIEIATEKKEKVDELEIKFNANENKITTINQRIESIKNIANRVACIDLAHQTYWW